MCGLSFLYYCSHKRISWFLFFLKSRFLTLWWEIRGVYFCLPKTKLWSVYWFFVVVVVVASFVNCILFHDEQKLFAIFFVIRLFFWFCFYFHLLCVNCTFYGTQKTKVSSVCLKLKYLTELKVYFPDLKDQNEIVESDERLCCRDGNVTCCFNSCTLFFYRTLGLSFYADHKCCPILFCLLYMSEMQHDFYSCMLTSFIPVLAGTW